MFWNDPILYGATLPYKDLPVQAPFFGQMFPQYNMPRFIPPMHGYLPPMQGFLPPVYYNLYNPPQIPQVPQIPQFMPFPQVPQAAFTPFVRPIEPNQPFYGWNRPFPPLY